MKKKLVAIALITGLAISTAASANWGRGGNGGYMGCQQTQQRPMMQGQVLPQLDQETQDKIKQFFEDTEPLHKQMVMKRAEHRAIMSSDKPDPQAAAKIAGEMFDLRTAIREKAELAGVDKYIGPGFKGRTGGRGQMGGKGRMGRQGGMGQYDCPQRWTN